MKLNVKEIVIFGMLGALMYASKLITDALPNIHLIGVFIVAITVVYRKKALYPIYIFVLLTGLFSGFGLWWVQYLYVWAVLWGAVMLLPKKMPKWLAPIVYATVCSVHGFLFGTLCAPAQALLFGLNFEQTLAWIASGIPFDIIHGVSNLLCGVLIMPMVKILQNAQKYAVK